MQSGFFKVSLVTKLDRNCGCRGGCLFPLVVRCCLLQHGGRLLFLGLEWTFGNV